MSRLNSTIKVAARGALVCATWSTCGHAAELKWSAPAGCPDYETVEHRIVDAMGIPLSNAAPLNCVAVVERRGPERWQLTLEITNPSDPLAVQRRSLEAVSCDKLAEAAAVALSLALGQAAEESNQALVTEIAPRPVEPTQPEASTAPPETKKAPQAPTNVAHKPWWAAGLIGLLDGGTLPKVAPGAEAFGTLGYRSFGMRVTGLLLPERNSSDVGPGGKFSLMAGSLAICGFSNAAGNVALCAGAEVGQLRGIGTNVTAPGKGQSLWVAPRVDVGWKWRLGEGFAFLVQGGAVTPLIRKQFKLGNVSDFEYQPGGLAWRLGLGVNFEWR